MLFRRHAATGVTANAPRPVAISLQANPVLAEILDEHKPVPANHKNSALAARKQELQAEGKRFLSWLADGLSDGGITVNQNDSMVHFIDRGMILVTPLVFKAYTNGFFDRNNPNCPGLRAQQGFLAVGWNERTANSAIFYAFAEDKFLFTCLLSRSKTSDLSSAQTADLQTILTYVSATKNTHLQRLGGIKP